MTEQQQETTFTQADIDTLNAKHQEEIKELETRLKGESDRKIDAAIKRTKAEMEDAAKKANMSEIEKAKSELEEYKLKYQEQADINALNTQKDETRKFMSENGLDEKCLEFVFVPKDLDGTKAKVKAFKEYIDNVKKETFESNIKSKVPGANSDGVTDEQIAAIRKSMGLPN